MKNVLIQSANLIVAMDLSLQLAKAGHNVWGISRTFEDTLANIDLIKPNLVLINPDMGTSSHRFQELKQLRVPYLILGEKPLVHQPQPFGHLSILMGKKQAQEA